MNSINLLQQTGHANDGFSNSDANSRVSRLLSFGVRQVSRPRKIMNAFTDGPGCENLDSTFRTRVLRSRVGILFVAIVFGMISALSIVGFVFNLTIDYPGTDRPVIVVDPLWMIGHVIRGLGLGVLTFHLWRYQVAIKHWHGPRGEGMEQFIITRATTWNTGAIVLGVLLVNALIYVAFGRGGAVREPQWDTVPYSSRRIELHRAELVPKEGLDEHIVDRTCQKVYVKPIPENDL